MFLAVNSTGQVWTGDGWSIKGKEFCSLGMLKRSLHEAGQDIEAAILMPSKLFHQIQTYDTAA
jgi:hypothetical protein